MSAYLCSFTYLLSHYTHTYPICFRCRPTHGHEFCALRERGLRRFSHQYSHDPCCISKPRTPKVIRIRTNMPIVEDFFLNRFELRRDLEFRRFEEEKWLQNMSTSRWAERTKKEKYPPARKKGGPYWGFPLEPPGDCPASVLRPRLAAVARPPFTKTSRCDKTSRRCRQHQRF